MVATVHSQQSSDLDFFDLDFEGEKAESDKDLTANLQLMNSAEHYGVTEVEWDPSGRFVATWASLWKHTVSLGGGGDVIQLLSTGRGPASAY